MTLMTAILNPKNATHYDVLNAYTTWLTVWSKTFKELGQSSLLSSDDFTRQDEIVALFDGPRCAALSFGRIVDLSSPIPRQDSYFDAWTFADMDVLRRDGDLVYISSYFTVAEDYRGTDVKHQLMRTLIRQFEWSDANVMTGTTRNAKGVNRLVTQHGFETIRTGAVMHGAEVDLTCYRRKYA